MPVEMPLLWIYRCSISSKLWPLVSTMRKATIIVVKRDEKANR
jgi:hypothetical protein